jgi:heterodisulfide reductase subunit C
MIDVTDLLTSLMNAAAKQGHIPEKVRSSAETVLHTGRALLVSRRVDAMRKKLGLKPLLQAPVEEVEGILEKTGLAALIG